ncbi:MAG TPA: hypothetical protein VGI99_05180 [Gemmataceae bacterium]|jgi:outer membrane protein TolC
MLALILATAFAAPEKPDVSAKVKELQKERIAALKEVADLSVRLALAGRIEPSEALEARLALLKAELESTEKESDRITLYKKAHEAVKAIEQIASDRFYAGRGTSMHVSKAKAMRLEIEIALVKAGATLPSPTLPKAVPASKAPPPKLVEPRR